MGRALLIPVCFLFFACGTPALRDQAGPPPLFEAPLTVPLDTIRGYEENKLTGEKISPVFNQEGKKVITGKTFDIEYHYPDPGKVSPPKLVTWNHSPRQEVPPVDFFIRPDTLPLPKVDILPLKAGVKAAQSKAILKVTSVREPLPVKALPMRSRDVATENIHFLDVDQGMKSSYVLSELVDSRGWLWFGTDGEGFSRYDGTYLWHYRKEQGFEATVVNDMKEDSTGRIWMATEMGLFCYTGTQFIRLSPENGRSFHSLTQLCLDPNGALWITTFGNGIFCYRDSVFTHYTGKDLLHDEVLGSCTTDSAGRFWIFGGKGLAFFTGNGFQEYPLPGKNKESLHLGLHTGPSGLWTCLQTEGRTWIYRIGQKNLFRFPLHDISNKDIWDILERNDGSLWLSITYGGIAQMKGDRLRYYRPEDGISNPKPRELVEDRFGNIWFGTDGGGVNRMKPGGFRYENGIPQLTKNRIRPLWVDKDHHMWMGTEAGGLMKYEKAQEPAQKGWVTHYNDAAKLELQGQRALLQDRKGRLWIGYTGGGIMRLEGDQFYLYRTTEGLSDNATLCLLEDQQGQIWAGSGNNGLSIFTKQGILQMREKEGLPDSKIYTLLEAKDGQIWMGTDKAGLCRYANGRMTVFGEKEGLFTKAITSLAEDRNGVLWIGTQGAGLVRFDGSRFTYYTQKNGLSNNYVWSLKIDAARSIWAGTNDGLNVLIPDTLKVDNNDPGYRLFSFNREDGMKASDFNLHSVAIDNTNRIWWGTGKNVLTLDLNTFRLPADPLPVRLSQIRIRDKAIDFRNLPDSLSSIRMDSVAAFVNIPAGLSLPHQENHLQFHFSAIDGAYPHRVKYSYRLLGLETGWSQPSDLPSADYRGLSPGHYVFEIKAIGQSQVWTPSTRFPFRIRPAWWQTLLFKIVVLLSGAILLLLISRLIYLSRLRKQQAEMEKKLAVQLERQRISAEMHDDIGAGLSGVRLLTEMTREKLKDPDAASGVTKIYDSVGDISARMKEVIWSLDTGNDNLNNLVFFILKQARAMLEHYPAVLRTELDETYPDISIDGEKRRHIYLCVKEALHNIIKHSGADQITLQIRYRDRLIIRITDNGKGLAGKSGETGNGWKNMRQRMQQVQGTLTVTEDNGLSLQFEIPLKAAP